jgi:HEAT repeat protein
MSTLIPYGDTTPEALPLIVGGLTHPNPAVQYGATWGVEKCWTNLQNQSSLFVRARVTLYQNLQNTNTKLAHTTALVLGRVDTGTIIDALNGKPADSTAALVPGAPDNLGNLIREKYVPLLVEVYNSDQSRSSLVIDLLGKLGPGARQAIPALLKVAQSDRNFITRNGAIKALEKIDPNVVRIHNLKLSPERRRGLSNGMDDAMRRRYGLGKPAPDVVRSQNLEATTNAPGAK